MTKRTRSFVIHVRACVRACVCVADPSLLQDYIKFGHIHTLTSQLHSILLLPLQNLTLLHSNTPLQNSAQRLNSIEYTVPEECDAYYFILHSSPFFILLTCSFPAVSMLLYFQSEWKTVWILIRWFRQKPADLDQHCLRKTINLGSTGQGLRCLVL